jgi:nucleoside-diphosphate-sugar epimerase
MALYLVAGAGGFIGGHLTRRLLDMGHQVRAVDIKPLKEWWQVHGTAHNRPSVDLRERTFCDESCRNVDYVINLAADMGGIGFIETQKAACMISVLINTHLLLAAKSKRIKRYFFSSSACAYAADKQDSTDMPALKEEDAYPAMPEDGYGWEKLFSERMCRHFMEDYGLETRVARFHNSYGPHGSWEGGREKAPAAICRKVAEAKLTGNPVVDIWGDGTRTRSFMWIEDNIDGILKIMHSDIREPINLGSSECVTINELVDTVAEIAGVQVEKCYDMTKPQGVHGRNSDNTRIKSLLNWEPCTPLRTGLEETYRWIEQQVRAKLGVSP